MYTTNTHLINLIRIFLQQVSHKECTWKPSSPLTFTTNRLSRYCLLFRVLQRAVEQCREISQWHVRADLWLDVCEERWALRAFLPWATPLLQPREQRRQPGRHANGFLDGAFGAHVSTGQRAVWVQRLVHGVCQQAHGGAQTLRWRSTQAPPAVDPVLHRSSHVHPRPDAHAWGGGQSLHGEKLSLFFVF